MLQGFNSNESDKMKNFQQRIADQEIQSIEDRQEEIQHAKNSFIGMLAGIVVGGIVGWLFFEQTDTIDKEKVIPVIKRPITPVKVQPNDPGGMEIDNQDREIYHIVDNLQKNTEEVNIIPAPEMPKLIVENSISAPENIENLVETIEEDDGLKNITTEINNDTESGIKIAGTGLSAIKTNSHDKVIIPEKIKDVEVKLQKSINSQIKRNGIEQSKEQTPQEPLATPSEKGTWYAQIIASSSRKAVENLWSQLSAKHTFLKTYKHEIEEITAANGSTLYRLKIGAFKERKEAEILSDKLKQNQISSIIKQN